MNVHFSTKDNKTFKGTGKYSLFIGEKKLPEIIPEEVKIMALLVKDIKLTILNIHNELKKTVDKEGHPAGSVSRACNS